MENPSIAPFPMTGGLLSSRLNQWIEASLGFVYPEACQLCGSNRAERAEGYVCGECWNEVRFIRPPFCNRCGLPFPGDITTTFECSNCAEMDLHFCWARSAVAARGPVREAIHRYKYKRHLWLENFLAELMIRGASGVLEPAAWDMLVPVPLHSVKHREREFNQAERLARLLSRGTKIPLKTRLLHRVQPTRTQTLLSRKERTVNMRHAFALQEPDAVNKQRIVLVDDVFTTGATTSACAKVLLKAGAASVAVFTLARGL